MLPAVYSMFSISSLLVWSSLLLSGVQAGSGEVTTRIGNRTIERTLNLRTHSLYAPYIDQDLQNRWWDFGADAYINTNKHVRLTRNKPSLMGWLWSRLVLAPTNFVVEVEYKISGDSTHLFGDGLAMWITTERAQPGPVFGSKDNFNGLAVVVDTYSNSRHSYSFPRISGFIFDGNQSYNVATDGDGQSVGGCSANIRRTNVATKIKVTYVKGSFLDVKVQYKAWDDWSDCFYVEGVVLPNNLYLGFSAMTGDVSDAHDIISVTTSSAILSPDTSPKDKAKKGIFGSSKSGSSPSSSSGQESGSWFGLFFKLLLLAGVVGGGWYGWKEYQRRKRYGGFGAGNNFGGGGGIGGGGGGMGMGMGGGGSGTFGMGGGRYRNPYANEKRF
ncbi:hypothetical protein Agabi119p4_2171 [Agaricus bisporus var. burnettii]|uniref:L-type lectin-like domain-containing protein n=1 Tax=Agaricus bisporus var. burnettii TaxID=192524 RepID=A0A8H7F8L2_AGABI|nr:hypothetical protein Agabi119p4_2171 [Agaricus bisporus var. burnettii]